MGTSFPNIKNYPTYSPISKITTSLPSNHTSLLIQLKLLMTQMSKMNHVIISLLTHLTYIALHFICKNPNTSCLLQITLETLKTSLNDDSAFTSFVNKSTVSKGYTALHYVCANCTVNEIKTLISYGAEQSAITVDGFNLLLCACMGSNLRNVVYIVEEMKFDINVKDNAGYSALHWSVFCNFGKGVDYLLSKGSNINDIDKSEMTPLHVALMKNENDDLIEELMFYNGIDLNKRDVYRRSYEDIAYILENEKFLTMLKHARREVIYMFVYIILCVLLFLVDVFEFLGFIPYYDTSQTAINAPFWKKLLNIYGYILIGLCVFNLLFVCFMMLCDKHSQKKRNVHSVMNNISHMEENTNTFINNTDEYLNSYCFFCKTIKNDNETTIHCMRCNKCIDSQIRHSCFYHKCITTKNRLFLFLIYLITLVHLGYICLVPIIVSEENITKDKCPKWMKFICEEKVRRIAKRCVLIFGIIGIIVVVVSMIGECKEKEERKGRGKKNNENDNKTDLLIESIGGSEVMSN